MWRKSEGLEVAHEDFPKIPGQNVPEPKAPRKYKGETKSPRKIIAPEIIDMEVASAARPFATQNQDTSRCHQSKTERETAFQKNQTNMTEAHPKHVRGHHQIYFDTSSVLKGNTVRRHHDMADTLPNMTATPMRQPKIDGDTPTEKKYLTINKKYLTMDKKYLTMATHYKNEILPKQIDTSPKL